MKLESLRRRLDRVAMLFSTLGMSWLAMHHAIAQDDLLRNSELASQSLTRGKLTFEPDLFTGQFNYSLPIVVPPGRQNSDPNISLKYNSSGRNGWCGVGWNLDMGFIERDGSHGVPVKWGTTTPLQEYDDSRGFVFSLADRTARLVNIGGNEYRAEVEGAWLKFVYVNPHWEVTDKSGNRYFFEARLEKPGWAPGLGKSTFRWGLSRIIDANGNKTQLFYTYDAGQMYLDRIDYNLRDDGTTVPQKSFVEFILEPRTDTNVSFTTGFRVETRKRLSSITVRIVKYTGPPNSTPYGAQVRRYALHYAYSPSTLRSLLKSVTEFGSSDTVDGNDAPAMPPISFAYQEQAFEFGPLINWEGVGCEGGETSRSSRSPGRFSVSYFTGDSSHKSGMIDIDGDGLLDRVMKVNNGVFVVQRNTGSGFAPCVAVGPVLTQSGSSQWYNLQYTDNRPEYAGGWTRTGLVDLNGDGFPERLEVQMGSYANFMVQLNTGVIQTPAMSTFSTPAVPWGPLLPENAANSLKQLRFADVGMPTRVDLIDLNGDGLKDRVVKGYYVQFNTGNGFGPYLTWPYTNPGGYEDYVDDLASYLSWTNEKDNNRFGKWLDIADINGDGLPDHLIGQKRIGLNPRFYRVQHNNGAGFEDGEEDFGPVEHQNLIGSAWTATRLDAVYDYSDDHVRARVASLIDMNGDGKLDRVFRRPTSPFTNFVVQLNTGTGFGSTSTWGGLVIQNSDAWWNAISASADDVTDQGMFVDFADINGDGLPDRITREENKEDVGDPAQYDVFRVQLNKGPFPDLLSIIDNGVTGQVHIAYAPSTQFDNRDKDWVDDPWNSGAKSLLPFPVYVVTSVKTKDGLGNSSTTTYNFKGGMFDSSRHEFRGFCSVEVTDPLALKTRYWFHQGGGRNESPKGEFQDAGSIGKKGMAFRIEHIGADAKIYSCTLSKIEQAQPYVGVYFPYASKTVQLSYADGVAYRATEVSREFDLATGNLLKEINHGEVQLTGLADHSWPEIESKLQEIGNDEVYSHATYYGTGSTPALSNSSIRDKVASHRITGDSAGQQILSETLFDYYGDTGMLVRRRDRICAGSYATNGYSYDVRGNLRFHTNEVGVVSETTYESYFYTFPVAHMVGSFVTTTTYDFSSGMLTDEASPSGLITKHTYDKFFRLKETSVSSVPNGTADVWKVRYDYNLGGIIAGVSQNSIEVKQNNALAGDSGHETWIFTDGLGRVIQTRVESEPQDGFAAPFRVMDLVYDQRGAAKYQALNYFAEGPSFVAPVGVKPCTYTEYDAAGRPLRITPAAGVTFANGLPSGNPVSQSGESDSPLAPLTLGYFEGTDPWVRTRTDEEGKVRKFFLDAFGRTNRIVEVVVAGTVGTPTGNYTTLFEHDKLDRLTKITDHTGSITEWAYDDLNRTVAMVEPHLGVWKWQRDFAGRAKEQTDGRGNLIKFFYTTTGGAQELLGRLLKKEVRDSAGTLTETVTYTYDSGSAGFTVYPGQLAAVTDGQGSQKFSYDVRGRTLKVERSLLINSTTYTTEQTFDDADRVETILYPANIAKVRNSFDSGGRLSMVQQVNATTGAPIGSPTYTSRGYTALGQSNGALFGNAVETSLSYFPSSKRIERLRTFKASVDLQNLTYKYTAANNVKAITDNVAIHTGTASATISLATYDELYRLTSIARPGVATVNYDYDLVGNVKVNGEAGALDYSYGTARPHAVKNANGLTYTYDVCGNMTLRGSQRLDYDARNRLVSVSANGTPAVTFGYADSGERLWKQTSAGLHVWIGALYEVRNGLVRFHVMADGKRIASIEPSTFTTHYQHGDHLGSASILTSTAGAETRHWEYSSYGRERYASAPGFAVSHRFTGQMLDDETGLYYYGARYYDPNLSRFIQADTIIPDFSNPQAFNRYAYTLNNPLRYVDPNGHGPREVIHQAKEAAITGLDFGLNYAAGLVVEVGLGVSLPEPTTTASYYGRQGGRYAGEAASVYLIASGSADIGTGAGVTTASVLAPETGPVALAGVRIGTRMMAAGAGKVALGGLMAGNVTKLQPLQKPQVNNQTTGTGEASTKLPRFDGPKPRYVENPAHIPGRGLRPGKTPLPDDARAVFQNAVPNDPKNPTAWFGRNADGQIYRFSVDHNGTAHFSGIDGVGDGVRNLTPYTLDRLNGL